MVKKQEQTSEAIQQFFKAVANLKEKNIIRSEQYLGDLGEYIVSTQFDIDLCDNKRNRGYDGMDKDGKRVQVKSHNAGEGKNVKTGNYQEYDDLYVVIGPNSRLKKVGNEKACFEIYKFKDYNGPKQSFGKEGLDKATEFIYLDSDLKIIK